MIQALPCGFNFGSRYTVKSSSRPLSRYCGFA